MRRIKTAINTALGIFGCELRRIPHTQQNDDDKDLHTRLAMARVSMIGGNVLVVGCNRGKDCSPFAMAGARVVGLDVIPEVGEDFINARYVRASAEDIPLESDCFDLVFAYATLEHVPDIRRAFREMARVTRPGGWIYSVAAPLWYCHAGPHWGDAFKHDPWPHLRYSEDQILCLAEKARKHDPANPYYEPMQVRYCVSSPEFNRHRPVEYLDACSSLANIELHRNEIVMSYQDSNHSAAQELLSRGFTSLDIFGLAHIVLGRKHHKTLSI